MGKKTSKASAAVTVPEVAAPKPKADKKMSKKSKTAAAEPEVAVVTPKTDKKASKKSKAVAAVVPEVAAAVPDAPAAEAGKKSSKKSSKKASKKSKVAAAAVPEVEAAAAPEVKAAAAPKTDKKASKKSKAAAAAAAVAAPEKAAAAPAVVTPAQTSNALADMFAQSSALFAKKTSYVQPEVATPAAATSSSKRKRAASTDAADESAETKKAAKAKVRSLEDDEVDEEEAAADAAERSLVLPAKKQKKKKHKTLAREAAEVAAAAAAANGEDVATVTATAADDAVDAPDGDKSARTVFVGNVSLDATQKDLKTFFTQCGKVESVRLRSMPLAGCAVDQAGNQKLMMKVCANKKILLDSKDHCNAYVTFAAAESVAKALALNGALFMLLAIRVDHENPVVDPKRSVFVGNVGFNVSDETVRKFFVKRLKSDDEPQPVQNVRIIRDRATGAGKGFGYVLLQSAALAAKALALHESKLEGRPIRVQVCGKRFKNKKGEDDSETAKKKHEGVRASVGAKARVALKRKAGTVKGAVSTKAAAGKAGKLAGVASSAKKLKPKHAARKALQAAEGSGAKKAFKKPSGSATATAGKDKSKGKPKGKKSFKKSERAAPKPKVVKPKHAARKARQAAEAAAAVK